MKKSKMLKKTKQEQSVYGHRQDILPEEAWKGRSSEDRDAAGTLFQAKRMA